MVIAGPTFHELTRLHPVLMLHLTAESARLHVEIKDAVTGQLLTVLGADEAKGWLDVLAFRGIEAIEWKCRMHGRNGRGTEPCTCAKVFRSRLFAATAKAMGNREGAFK